MTTAEAPAPVVGRVPIASIDVPDDHERTVGDLDGLKASMASEGQLQAVLIRPKGDRYELVAGLQRLTAAKELGWERILAEVKEADDISRVIYRTIENIQRTDLHPIEEAHEYRRLHELGVSQKDVARRVGRSPVHVSQRLALLDLPEAVQKDIGRTVTIGDALELHRLRDNPGSLGEAWEDIKKGMPAELAVKGQLRRLQVASQMDQEAAAIVNEGLTLFTGVLGQDGHRVTQEPSAASGVSLYWPADRDPSVLFQWQPDSDGGRNAVVVNAAPYLEDEDPDVRASAEALLRGTAEKPAEPITDEEAEKRKGKEKAAWKRALKKRDDDREKLLTSLVRKGVKYPEVGDLIFRTLIQNLSRVEQDAIYARCAVARVEREEGFGESWNLQAYLEGATGSWLKLGYCAALNVMESEVDEAVRTSTRMMHGEQAERTLRYLTHLQQKGYVVSDNEATLAGMDQDETPEEEDEGVDSEE